MGMGGFVLKQPGCRAFPIVFGAEFSKTKQNDGPEQNDGLQQDDDPEKDGGANQEDAEATDKRAVMEPNHFNFRNFDAMETVESSDEIGSATLKRTISQNEIMDRSKGDCLAKTIILLQLIWFLVQIVARKVQRLYITPLEFTTSAYIVASGILYIIWWKKPKDVRYPIGITLTDGNHREMYRNAKMLELLDEPMSLAFVLGYSANHNVTSSHAVRLFYSGKLKESEDRFAFLAEMVLGCIFGGIHCIAWSFNFQTHLEQRLWRISSVITIGTPLVPILWVLLSHPKMMECGATLIDLVNFITCFTGMMVYIVARLILLGLALSTLRNLPEDALHVVPWTSVIPHFG
jgi:hypothetical protein